MEYLTADKADAVKIAAMHIAPSVNLSLDNIEKRKDFRLYFEKVNFFMQFEPEGVIVAKEGSNIVGFIIITKDAGYLMRNIFLKGYVFRWAILMALRRFGLDVNMIKKSIRYLLSFSFLPLIAAKKIPSAKIMAIIVAKEKRGLGIGSSLVDKAIEYLRKNKIKSLCVATEVSNILAIKFYQSCGFSLSGTCVESVGRSFILTKSFDS